ncbi:MAG: hypothetical protein JSR46_10380 [Verrucomicrobia bacterium]|nr:hypothetical protein [Verrucomicrobiota bacterium]
MDFTREPIIETVITPREGHRLVVRSSKSATQEEHFVDALEVVSFGNALFFRCIERPKPFIVPVADYEVLEVREPRIVLKTPMQERTAQDRGPSAREHAHKPKIEAEKKEPVSTEKESQPQERQAATAAPEGRNDRRRERRRPFRRRRGQAREETEGMSGEERQEEESQGSEPLDEGQKILSTAPMLSSILPPPATLVRDDLPRLREQEVYKGAFFIRDEKDDLLDDDDDAVLKSLRSGSFMGDEESRDQEVSPEEPFCDPFFNEPPAEATAQNGAQPQEDAGSIEEKSSF